MSKTYIFKSTLSIAVEADSLEEAQEESTRIVAITSLALPSGSSFARKGDEAEINLEEIK